MWVTASCAAHKQRQKSFTHTSFVVFKLVAQNCKAVLPNMDQVELELEHTPLQNAG